MKTKSLTNLCHTLGDAFRRCARRFPVTLGFAFALTAYLCFQVATEGEAGEKKLLMTIGYFLSVGTLLSLSLHLWAEEVKRRKLRLGVQIVAPVLLASDAVFLYHNIGGTRAIDIGIAHGAALLAIGLSVFFLPFFRERDDIPAWNFAQTAVGTLALAVIVGAVMSGGLSLLAFSLHQLFGVEVSYKCYLYHADSVQPAAAPADVPRPPAGRGTQARPAAATHRLPARCHPLPLPAAGRALPAGALRLRRHHPRAVGIARTDGCRGSSWH